MEQIINKFTLFDEKKDILHFFLGIVTGIGIVFFVAFDKILY